MSNTDNLDKSRKFPTGKQSLISHADMLAEGVLDGSIKSIYTIYIDGKDTIHTRWTGFNDACTTIGAIELGTLISKQKIFSLVGNK